MVEERKDRGRKRSRGCAGNLECSSLRLKCLSWKDASSSRDTCQHPNETTWPTCWSSPQHRSKYGSRTGGTSVRDSARIKLWSWPARGGWRCPCWCETANPVMALRTMSLCHIPTITTTTAMEITHTTVTSLLFHRLPTQVNYPTTLWIWVWRREVLMGSELGETMHQS